MSTSFFTMPVYMTPEGTTLANLFGSSRRDGCADRPARRMEEDDGKNRMESAVVGPTSPADSTRAGCMLSASASTVDGSPLSPPSDIFRSASGGAPAGERAQSEGVSPAVGGASTGVLERALVEQAKSGDRRAVAQIYRTYRPRIERTVARYLKDRGLAEDVTADTFVRAMERLGEYEWKGRGFGPWLNRIARNLCLDVLRRSGRDASMPEGFEQTIPDTDSDSVEWIMSALEDADLAGRRVAQCLAVIKPRYARALQLRFLLKVPRPLAAHQMDVKIGTFDVLVCRASAAFRKAYAEQYGPKGE